MSRSRDVAQILGKTDAANTGNLALLSSSLDSAEAITLITGHSSNLDSADMQTISAQVSGNRNRIINGALTVWQRSISSTSTGWGYYTADRWNTNLRDGAGTMSQYDMGSELQPFVYAFKTAITSAASSKPVVQQKIEDSRRFKNQTVTFSFYAKASKAITVDTVFDLLWANSSNATTTQSNSITTSWQRFTYTVTLPNPSGSYNATYDHLYCRFSLPISDTYDFYITGVQLEVGDIATAFEHEDTGTTLLKCQRYYQINYASWYGVAQASGYFVSSNITYKPDLRANPALAQKSFSSGSGGRFTATAATSSTINGTLIYSSPGSAGGNSGYYATWSADAEL
jgi:hypothetical protein